MLPIAPPYPVFTDVDGSPLEDGFIWIGPAGINPETSPADVFFDRDGLITAPQPIRTLDGYPSNNGTPAAIYTEANFSLTVRNKNNALVFSSLAPSYINAVLTEFLTTYKTLTEALASNLGAGSFFVLAGRNTLGDIESVPYQVVEAGTGTPDNGSFINLGSGLQMKLLWPASRGPISVAYFGSFADGESNAVLGTNQSPAWDNTKVFARTIGVPVWIPPSKNFYALDTAYKMDNASDILLGVYLESIIVARGSQSCIVIGANDCVVKGFYLSGLVGSGNGIECFATTVFNDPYVEDVFMFGPDNDGIHVSQGISGVWKNVFVDQNAAYRPACITALGASRGSINTCLFMDGDNLTGGNSFSTQNHSFYGCHFDGCNQSVRAGGVEGSVTTLHLYGCLFQGWGGATGIHIVGNKCGIHGGHIEDAFPIGDPPGEWGIILEGSAVSVDNVNSVVDTLIQNAENCGLRGCTTAGVRISSNSVGCYVTDSATGGQSTGPTGGRIEDLNGRSILRRLNMGAASSYGDNLPDNRFSLFRTNMEDWQGGVSPTLPCGFYQSGGTVAREATIVHSGSFSTKFTATSDTQYLIHEIPEAVQLRNRRVMVETWVRADNLFGGLGNIIVEAFIGGPNTIIFTGRINGEDAFRRLIFSFVVPDTANSILIRYRTADTAGGIFYVDDYSDATENLVTLATEKNLDTMSATPSLFGELGYAPDTILVAASGTAVTGFTNYIVGKHYKFKLGGNRTFTGSATLKLVGGTFGGTADDTFILQPLSDGIFYELSRSAI